MLCKGALRDPGLIRTHPHVANGCIVPFEQALIECLDFRPVCLVLLHPSCLKEKNMEVCK